MWYRKEGSWPKNVVHSSSEILSFIFLGLFTLTRYVKLRNRRMFIVLPVFGRRFPVPVQNRNCLRLDTVFYHECNAINGLNKWKYNAQGLFCQERSSEELWISHLYQYFRLPEAGSSHGVGSLRWDGIHAVDWGRFPERLQVPSGSKFLQAQ